MAGLAGSSDTGRDVRALKPLFVFGFAAGLFLSLLPASALAGVCDQDGYRPVKRFHRGAFMQTTSSDDGTEYEHVYVCSSTYGLHATVGKFNTDPEFLYYGRLVARGRTAAWATAVGDEGGDTYLDKIGKTDLGSGARSFKKAVSVDTYSSYTYTGILRSIAVAGDGRIAWMVDYENHGKSKREITIWDASGSRIVSRSLVATPRYLAFVLGAKPSEVSFSRKYRGEEDQWPAIWGDLLP
jgi:hypothetical protein